MGVRLSPPEQRIKHIKMDKIKTFVLIPEDDYKAILKGIEEIKDLINGKAAEQAKTRWIESNEARQMLGVSPKTWQAYRDERVLPFSQFGRKIYVRQSDLEAFFEKHRRA